MPASLKLWSHAKSFLQTNFSCLTQKCELVSCKWPTDHKKCKLDPTWETRSPCKSCFLSQVLRFWRKEPRGWVFLVYPKRMLKLQNFRIPAGHVFVVLYLVLFLRRVGIVEESAIRELKERLYANKIALMAAFLERDKENTGKKHLVIPFQS